MELNTLGWQGRELVAGHVSWLIFMRQKTEPGNPPPNILSEKEKELVANFV